MMVIARHLYDNSSDNDEMDAAYNKLKTLYQTLLKATGIEGITANAAIGSIYDLSGRSLSDVSKSGIYIVDGKKVLLRQEQ